MTSGDKSTEPGLQVRIIYYRFAEGSEVLAGDSLTVELGRAEGEAAGSYAITLKGWDNSNYAIECTPGVFTITGQEEISLVVTTTSDDVNPYDGVTSLREALAYAANNESLKVDGKYTITFADSIFTNDEAVITIGSTLEVSDFTSTHGKLVISGRDGKSVILDGSNQYQILTVASGNTVTLNKLTFRNGTDENISSEMYGGAIYNCGTLTVADSVFEGNSSEMYGGAIYNEYGSLSVYNSTFTENTALSQGGAIFSVGSYSFYVSNSTFEYNTAGEQGGAIVNWGGSLTVSGSSSFCGNAATNSYGGAIFNYGTLSVSNSSFEGNTAGNLGGAIYNYSGSMSVTNSRFNGNTAEYSGGAVYNEGGDITITNSTFIENTAVSGGAVSNARLISYSTFII